MDWSICCHVTDDVVREALVRHEPLCGIPTLSVLDVDRTKHRLWRPELLGLHTDILTTRFDDTSIRNNTDNLNLDRDCVLSLRFNQWYALL